MNTATLPGWLQVVLVFLSGLVGWILLRPYRRVAQLGGKEGARSIATGSWHRSFFRDMREAAKSESVDDRGQVVSKGGRSVYVDQGNLRPEARLEDPAHSANRSTLTPATTSSRDGVSNPIRPDGKESVRDETPAPASAESTAPAGAAKRATPSRRGTGWTEPDVAEQPSAYAIYRPETGSTTAEPATPRIRSEAK
jgi:hypothetical protein